MRNGNYGIYQGKLYSLIKKGEDQFKLIARNVTPIYTKMICKQELKMAYRITTYADYKGYTLQVVEERENEFLLSTSEDVIYTALNMKMRGRGDYEKWISKSEPMTLWEKRIPIEHYKSLFNYCQPINVQTEDGNYWVSLYATTKDGYTSQVRSINDTSIQLGQTYEGMKQEVYQQLGIAPPKLPDNQGWVMNQDIEYIWEKWIVNVE